MLWLRRLEIEGLGPYYDPVVLEFPEQDGVTVVYGDNMRGKTSLLNAIYYAFFGIVCGRNLRRRPIAKASNRDRAKEGRWGFKVSLAFAHDDDQYELVRQHIARVQEPVTDDDFAAEVYLRRNGTPLGPEERKHALDTVLPEGVARFFLFDGERLNQYAELVEEDGDAGVISAAIEEILGVPVLRNARAHLVSLAEEAEAEVAREAKKRDDKDETSGLLSAGIERRKHHAGELKRLSDDLATLQGQKRETDDFLRSKERYAAAMAAKEQAQAAVKAATAEEAAKTADLKTRMADAWRTLLGETVRVARLEAEDAARDAAVDQVSRLRRIAIDTGHCDACDQDVPGHVRDHLRAMLPAGAVDDPVAAAAATTRASALRRFEGRDVADAVRMLSADIGAARIAQVTLRDRIGDLEADLAESDEDVLRTKRASLTDLGANIHVTEEGIKAEESAIARLDANITKWTDQLAKVGNPQMAAAAAREKFLHDAAAVFAAAVEQYKADLRGKVAAKASELFLEMTTEKVDYARLEINDRYGLSIVHRDGEIEEGASEAAQQVVALALMGALQANAPLRGPIVMDTPFSRLDRGHKPNVVRTLPTMARQVVLFVQEGEITRDQVRTELGARLLREYELEYETARFTRVEPVR